MNLTDEEKLFLLQLLEQVTVKGLPANIAKVEIMKKLDAQNSGRKKKEEK
jgi:hypothetical protein